MQPLCLLGLVCSIAVTWQCGNRPPTTVARARAAQPTIVGNTNAVAATTVAPAATTVAGAATTVAGAATTVAGAATTVAGAATTVAGAATTVAGAATTVAGMTTTAALTTTSTTTTTTTTTTTPCPCAATTDPTSNTNPSATVGATNMCMKPITCTPSAVTMNTQVTVGGAAATGTTPQATPQTINLVCDAGTMMWVQMGTTTPAVTTVGCMETLI